MTLRIVFLLCFILQSFTFVQAENRQVPATHPDVAYGDHKKQCFDLWLVPDAEEPTPLVIYIHGGGFRGGDKSSLKKGVAEGFLKRGIAFASMNYRLSDSGPYPIMMHDAARGLQTIRHHATEWKINPQRIVCYGGSAGAGISLWLAFHDDLSDPDSKDPIARQSTRIHAVGTTNGQSTYNMHTFREWFGVPNLPVHNALPPLYGVDPDADLNNPEVTKQMQDVSSITHLSADDQVDVYMTYSRRNKKVNFDTSKSDWVHHPLLGLKLKAAMQKLGLKCYVTAPDIKEENDPYGSLTKFLVAKAKE